MLPFVENLKRNLPDITLSIAVNEGTEEFFYDCPAVDNVIPFPRKMVKERPWGVIKFLAFVKKIRDIKPDLIIELTDSDRPAIISFFSGARIRISYNNEDCWRKYLYTHLIKSKINTKHMVEYHLDVLRELGMKIYDDSINIYIDKKHLQSLKEKIPSVFYSDKNKKKVVIHPGARNFLRQWGAEKFAYLCDMLSDMCRIFLIGGPDESDIIKNVLKYIKTPPEFCSTDLTINEFAALCELSDLFIGSDSGPIHIASSKTFVVGIYGPTMPELAGPWTKRKLLFSPPPLECRPCRQDKCQRPLIKECLELIKPKVVVEKLREVIKTL